MVPPAHHKSSNDQNAPPRPRRILFAAILILASLTLSVAAMETFLRLRKRTIQHSDRQPAGMFQYDQLLGWKLTPSWEGRHRHFDYTADYSTSQFGFRNDSPWKDRTDRPIVAVLGDSFTFGLGVDDDGTFVHHLNEAQHLGARWLNFAIPASSTDQQLLLLKHQVRYFRPRLTVLMVYLANDLFDNLYPYPLQAVFAKPHYELTDDGLVLNHVPVPHSPKPAELRDISLGSVAVGRWASPQSYWQQLCYPLELFHLLEANFFPTVFVPPVPKSWFDDQYAEALELFFALVDEMMAVCESIGSQFVMIILPGRSLVDRPGSLSAQYQDYLRKTILRRRASIPILDLASHLREHAIRTGDRLFYPHDGHFTVRGHQAVAAFIRTAIAALESAGDPGKSR